MEPPRQHSPTPSPHSPQERHSPPPQERQSQPLWLTVPYWFVTVGCWVLSFQLIPSHSELTDVGQLVGVFALLAVIPLELLLFCAYLKKQHGEKKSRLLKDFFDAGSLFLGLLLQDQVEEMAPPAIALLVAFLTKMFLIFVMAGGTEDFGIIDLFLGFLTQAMIASYRRKRIDLMILAWLICVILTTVRNRFADICAYLSHFSGSRGSSEQLLPVAQTREPPVAQTQPREPPVAQTQPREPPVAQTQPREPDDDDRHPHTPTPRSSGSHRTPPSRKPPSRPAGKQM